MATLGRPFTLGMLYDARSEQLVPGVTLWNSDTIAKNTWENPNQESKVDVIASDSISEKAKALNINADLKLSFLAGIVSAHGTHKHIWERNRAHLFSTGAAELEY